MRTLSPSEFSTKYGIRLGNIAAYKKTNTGLAKFILPNGNINEDKFIETTNFVSKLYLASHTLYYPMIDHFGSVAPLSRILAEVTDRTVGSWNTWISGNLFKDTTVTNPYYYQKMRYEFVVICAALFKMLDLAEEEWLY